MIRKPRSVPMPVKTKIKISNLYRFLAQRNENPVETVNAIFHAFKHRYPTINFEYKKIPIYLQHSLVEIMSSAGYRKIELKKGRIVFVLD